MSTPKTSRLTVDLELGADPIRGSIARSGEPSRHFWGWLELIEVLERAAADRPVSDLPAERSTQHFKAGRKS